MDFAFSDEDEQLRADVRAFIREHVNPDVIREFREFREGKPRGPHLRAVFDKLRERGWVAISWPKKYGGQGGTRIAQYLVEEEFLREGGGLRVAGGGTGSPAILASGTDAQKDEYIPGSIASEVVFCQGYSEPHCGTDLAGIRCRATRKDDKYIINGQKIFTTNAQNSSHIFLLARTDPESRRQAGLSVLLVPMDTPGITVRALWTVQSDPPAPHNATYGEIRTNEVFFDNVEVPVSCRLGEEGDGWNVAQRGLNIDRVGAWRYLISVHLDEDIVNHLKAGGDDTKHLREDAAVRNTIADLWTEGQMCRLMTMRSISIDQAGKPFVYEGSAEKIAGPEHGVRATEAISQILGPHAQLLSSSRHTIENGVFAHNLLGAFQSTVNHGSVQVMRDQVARKALDMPRSGIKTARKETRQEVKPS
jgi:alkylation response protein AidB-like acyl-CoA dehydrogenase